MSDSSVGWLPWICASRGIRPAAGRVEGIVKRDEMCQN